MSYLVLARKWRPQRFDDVVGQGHITRVLRNAIRAGRIAHAYLFTGVRGVGKTTAARILAKALNCEKGPTPDPCGECSSCAEIRAGSSIDVYEIDGASNRGIDEVRQIIENVRYQPAKSRFKIYIIDEVHQVTKDAFNALLKTLEEPPPFVKFILATTEPHRLPETILSRCQRFDFRRIPLREIVQRLDKIASEEKLRISEGALLLLARESEGSMRDAQSLLEQILSYAVPDGEKEKAGAEVDERMLEEVMGIAERKVLYDLSDAVVRGDAKQCVDLVAGITAQGRDVARLSRDLVEHFRNLLVARLAPPASFDQLLDLPDREMEDLRRQAAGLSVDTLMEYFRFMAEGDEEVARSPYPRFSLETALIRLATLPGMIPVNEIVERLERLEKKLPRGERVSGEVRNPINVRNPMNPTNPNALRVGEPPGESRPSKDLPEPSPESSAEVWKHFVAFVMKEKKVLASHLERARPLEIAPGRLKIGVEEKFHLSSLQEPESLSLLKNFARQFFSGETAVTVAPTTSKDQKEPREEASAPGGVRTAKTERDDMVEEALRIFGGSVRQVKKEG